MTKSLEDYLEAIYRLSQQNGCARVAMVAKMLGVKMPSVNNAVKELSRLKLITHAKYCDLELTAEGILVAKKIYESHLILRDFLLAIGVSEENAEADACKMEHILSEETTQQLKSLTPHILQKSNNHIYPNK